MRILSLPFLHSLRQLGPLSVRLGVGVVIALHGWTKWQTGAEGWRTGEALVGMTGFGPAEPLAWLVMLVELVGGILIVLGLLTRISALGVAINMMVALWRVKGLAFVTGEGQVWAGNIDWVLLFGALGLLFMGPGKIALDALLGIERD